MNAVILDDIPFEIELSQVLQKLHIDRSKYKQHKIERLLKEAQAIARPKAIFKPLPIEEWGDDYVMIEEIKLTSRVLAVNLSASDQAFLYAATCGVELEDWSGLTDDNLLSLWMYEIKGLALDSAITAMDENITNRFDIDPISSMSPGSLEDWPLEEQRGVFHLLGDLKELIGIELLDNLWMTPSMSVSGIRFRSEDHFESCQLCPREVCSERGAAYDEGLYDRKYRLDLG